MPRVNVVKDPDFIGNKDFHSSYNLNPKTKEWEFVGYKCMHCERLFKTSQVRVKHLNTCRGISRKTIYVDPDPTIYDKNGKLWKPFTETNQN